MNLKHKWHALPKWKQAALSLVIIPLLPLFVAAILVAIGVGALLAFAMDCIDDVLNIIYKDDP